MEMCNRKLLEVGFRLLVFIILCAIVVEITQTIAMIIVVGIHEFGHAIVGVANGETLKGLPSISITGLTLVSVRGNTEFTDNLHATKFRVIAGPLMNLLIGVILSWLLIFGKGYGWLKSGTKVGFAVEAVILVLFWSGFAIVTQFTGGPGTDMGDLTADAFGQIFELVAVLIGMLILISLIFGRAKKICLILGLYTGQGKRNKKRMVIVNSICLLASIIMVLTAPVHFSLLLGWLFMGLTGFYYAWLTFEYKWNFAIIGRDLNYFTPDTRIKRV